MKDRLTKLFTTFLAVVLLVGMSPAAASTAYAASWNSGTVASLSWGNWLKNLFGGSNKGDSSDKEKGDASLNNSQSNDATGEQSDPEPSGGGTTQQPLELTKRINDDGTKITLEAYATGKVTKVDTYTPTDIVLVLDQSGSMNEALGSVTEVSGSLDTSKTYLVGTGNSRYKPVTYLNNSWKDESGKQYTPKSSNNKKGTQFYEGTTKLQALKSAATVFVQNIEKSIQDSKNKAIYRVSIVGYSYEKDTKLLTGKDVNDTLQTVNSETGKTNIMNAINGLYGNGSTRADTGISLANDIFKANPIPNGEKRNRAVIMFTDGEPNDSNGFEHNIAIDAINNAKTTKNTYNASVFTVGILQGADPTATFPEGYSNNSSERINRYMHYVSSNYPNASGSYRGSSYTYKAGNDGDKTRGFYMTAKDASGLNKVFANIAGSIESPSSNIDLGEQASLRDIISEDFHLPEGTTTDKIIVKTAKYAGKDDNGNLTWEEAKTFKNAQVSIDDKTINVTNFSYKDNYVLDTKDGPVGYKLIVEIPVEINRTFGGNNIESNAAAGIYESKSSETALITAESPKVDDPIDYEIAGTTQTIPDGTSVTKESLFEYVKDASNFEYKPDGLKNKFVNLTYTIKDGENIVGIYTIEAGKNTGSWSSVDESKITELHSDKEYSIECKITPITEGTVTEATKTATSYVYIEGVTRAFVIDFAKPVTYTKEQVFTKNQINTNQKVNAISYKEGTNTYGNLTFNTSDKSITYKLKKFMDGIDTYKFNVANECTQTVKMVPASSVYYEDNFGEETDADGKVTTKSIIDYDDNWTTVKDGNVVTSINGDDPVGYDSAYEGQTKFSSGSARMAKATDGIVKASFTFKGSGIDLYGYTSGNTGKMIIQLYKLDDQGNMPQKVTYSTLVDTKYNSGEVYQTPLFSYMGTENAKYKVVVTVLKGSAIYLDALRVYYPIGTSNENYKKDENNIQYVDIRDQIFNPEYFSVSGKLFVDTHAVGHDTKPAHIIDLSKDDDKAEYSTYGRKREVAIAPGGTVTLSGFKNGISVKQIGMRTNALAPDEFKLKNATGIVDINGEKINLNSATDMYYNVTIKDGKLEITNNTNYIITLTNLKLK